MVSILISTGHDKDKGNVLGQLAEIQAKWKGEKEVGRQKHMTQSKGKKSHKKEISIRMKVREKAFDGQAKGNQKARKNNRSQMKVKVSRLRIAGWAESH